MSMKKGKRTGVKADKNAQQPPVKRSALPNGNLEPKKQSGSKPGKDVIDDTNAR